MDVQNDSWCKVARNNFGVQFLFERNASTLLSSFGGFSSSFVDLKITKSDNLLSASKKALMSNFGCTNPSAAIEYAIRNKMDIDKFVFITDNDVNSGNNPAKMLKEYRRVMKKPSTKMLVFGLTASNFSIADPKDSLMLDCAGFSGDMTSLIVNF